MEISILGPLEIRHVGRRVGPDGLGGRKPKQVLEILAAARGRAVAKEVLIDRLWEARLPSHPVAALENHIWVLRQHLASLAAGTTPVVIAASAAYRLDTQAVTIDIDVFDQLVEQADAQGWPEGRRLLESALGLVRGEVLEDEPYADWAASLRDTYRAEVHRVLLDSAEGAWRDGELRAAVVRARQALELDPLSERACRLCMLGLAGLGERHQAVRAFETLRARLRADLDLEPLPETLAVYERIRDPRGLSVA